MGIYDINGNILTAGIYPISLHEMPVNNGVLNVIKRARQLTDIKWKPAIDLPRLNRFDNDNNQNTGLFEDVFKAGVEYTGIPYSSAKGTKVQRYGYTRLTVGSFIGLDTFATAVANPNSFVGKESEYDTSIMLSVMYGSTCCGLVSYALGIPWTNTEDFGTLITNGTLISKGLVSTADDDDFSLADVLVKTDTHIAMISDIIRDESGNVLFVEVSENTTHGALNPSDQGSQYGGHARRMGWSKSDFVRYFGAYTLCNYRDISNVSYTPSIFVNVGDTFDVLIDSKFPCLPYMGENFVYKVGNIYNSDILIATDYFSELDVYKDGTLFNTFSISSGDTKKTVGFSAAGSYEAFLCNKSGTSITEKSKSCHWTVISEG